MVSSSVTEYEWTRISDIKGPKPTPRHGHRACHINDMIVFFGGGKHSVGILSEINVYSLKRNEWFEPNVTGDGPVKSASFGFVAHGTRIYLFGGQIEVRWTLSADLYVLNTETWTWTKLHPMPPENNVLLAPFKRLGHTFTLIGDTIYLFGGINIQPDSIHFLNDLYTLDLSCDPPRWKIPITYNEGPSARESHTAVCYQCEGFTYLVIFGGRSELGRCNDLWLLDVKTNIWTNPCVTGPIPLGRSMHSATVFGHRMFVLGGWEAPAFTNPVESNCSNTFACLNLQKFTWERSEINDSFPGPRAGHCAVGIDNRLYIWSGRAGFWQCVKTKDQIFWNDLYMIEVDVAPPAELFVLLEAKTASYRIYWRRGPSIPILYFYVLECQDIAGDPNNADEWNLVGIFKDSVSLTAIAVSTYIDRQVTSLGRLQSFKKITSQTLPNLARYKRDSFEPYKPYRFRLAAINGYGLGPFGQITESNKRDPFFPHTPSIVRIEKSAENSVKITWNNNNSGQNVQYLVHLAMPIDMTCGPIKQSPLNFALIWSGTDNQCTISTAVMAKASINICPSTQKPYFLFRITVKNDSGYGRAAQYKWIQQSIMGPINSYYNVCSNSEQDQMKAE